jgi:uncharacterized membrane protein required for colicin V production
MENLSTYDLFILFIISASSILALLKGFIRSLLSITSLISSLILAYFLYPLMKPLLSSFIENSLIVQIITCIGAYIISLLTLAGITSKINKWTENFRGGTLDRILGLIFGFIRGYLLGFVIYFIIISFTNVFFEKDLGPKWLQNSITTPLFKPFYQYLKPSSFNQDLSTLNNPSKKLLIHAIKDIYQKMPSDNLNILNKKDLKNIENISTNNIQEPFIQHSIKKLFELYEKSINNGQMKEDLKINNEIENFKKSAK